MHVYNMYITFKIPTQDTRKYQTYIIALFSVQDITDIYKIKFYWAVTVERFIIKDAKSMKRLLSFKE